MPPGGYGRSGGPARGDAEGRGGRAHPYGNAPRGPASGGQPAQQTAADLANLLRQVNEAMGQRGGGGASGSAAAAAVSYTHLTLPTIYSV